MKEISQSQSELIVEASNEGLTQYPAAALEKDILLTEILFALRSEFVSEEHELQIVFGGGTSLVKGYSLLARMSEDLDFKIVHPTFSREELDRKALGVLRNSIQSVLSDLGFQILNSITRDSRRYFSFELDYASSMDTLVSLRSHILLEFTSSFIFPEPVRRNIQTLLYQDTTITNPYRFDFPCVSPLQTTAEKIIGILRKVETIKSGKNERLIRHLYDIHKVVKAGVDVSDLSKVISLAVTEDFSRYGAKYPAALKNDSFRFLRDSGNDLLEIPRLEAIYKTFVGNLTSGKAPTLAEVSQSFNLLLSGLN